MISKFIKLFLLISCYLIVACNDNTEIQEDDSSAIADTTSIQSEVVIDSVNFEDIANDPLSKHIDPYNLRMAEQFLQSVTAPEQYYLRTWMAQEYPKIFNAVQGDEEQLLKAFEITFDHAAAVGKQLADKHGMTAEDLKKSFDRKK